MVDKPAGVPVIPVPGLLPATCLRDRVASAIGTRAWVVHRIDRDASGVVVFARTAEAHRALSRAFGERDVHRGHVAFVHGVPQPSAGEIAVPLCDARRGKARPALAGDAGARQALTTYAVSRVWQYGALRVARVAATPHTDCHHQIRVHLRSLGTPILGDAVYGRAAGREVGSDMPVPRLALHAATIDLPHPADGRRVVAEAPLSADLAALAAWLDAHAALEPVS